MIKNDRKKELLQVLDESGNETGKLLCRDEIHKNGFFHDEISCIVLNFNKQVLLQKRNSKQANFPNCWTLCSGHVIGYTPIEEAAIAEIAEEFGSEIKTENIFLLLPKFCDEQQNKNGTNRRYVTTFATFINKQENDFLFDKTKIDSLKWVDFDEFKKMIKEPLKRAETTFLDNQYYNNIIFALTDLFGRKDFHKKVDDLTEKLEEIDKYGNPTGKIITREFAHNYGIYHKAVSLFVINKDNEILLQKRAMNKIRNAGLWDVAVSGHIRYGENEIIALAREAEEEIGLTINAARLDFLVRYKENRKFSKIFIDNGWFNVYVLRIDNSLKNIKNLEVDGIKFVSVGFLKKLMETYEELAYKPEAFEAIIKYIENNKGDVNAK